MQRSACLALCTLLIVAAGGACGKTPKQPDVGNRNGDAPLSTRPLKPRISPQPPRRPVQKRYFRHIKAIVGATVIGTRVRTVVTNATVLIKGDRIVAVGPKDQVQVPSTADVIDGRGKYVIPGLVDGHIHFFQSGGLYTRPDGLDLRKRRPYTAELQWIRSHMDDVFRRYIRSGVTTVVDLGGPLWNFDVRDQARKARVAPRVFVAGPLIASYQPKPLTTKDPPILRVNTVAEALALVRQQVAKKTDLIKIWYVASKKLVEDKLALHPDRFYPIVQAVVRESHRHGVKVWVHATELEIARKAVVAGADVLVHSVRDRDVDDAFVTLLKTKQVIYIPTPWVFSSYAAVYSKQLRLMKVEHLRGNPMIIGTLFDMHQLDNGELGPRQRKLQANPEPIVPSPIILRNLKRLHRAGVTVAAGTDAGNVGVLHGPAIFHDFALMSEAGLSNHDILLTATWNGARLLGLGKELGSVEPGRLADLVVLNSNPLTDIQNAADTHLVFKGGQVYAPGQVVPLPPEDVAQIQLNAYNARDLESFLAVYSPDVKVYAFPDKLLFQGKSALRERYGAFFRKAKVLHCRLVRRIRQGRFVIDREHVTTSIPGREQIEATAIYDIRDGLINTVWFLK
ncbi:MAG: amidohydrolase family protein [bacterium]